MPFSITALSPAGASRQQWFLAPHLPAAGSAAAEDSALLDLSDDRFAAKDARAFAKSAQETAICSQVCFWISLGEVSAATGTDDARRVDPLDGNSVYDEGVSFTKGELAELQKLSDKTR